MRSRYLFLAVLVLMSAVGGCFNSDDSGGGLVVASGSTTIASGATPTLATISVSQPGLLQATVTWTGDPTEATAAFKHVVTSTPHGLVMSPSPLVSNAAVTSSLVAAGENWEFVMNNPAASSVTVSFSITFLAD